MIVMEKIREELDKLPTFIYGGLYSRGPTQYVARQDVLSMLDKIPCLDLQRLRQRAEEIYVEEFSGGVAIENQRVLAEACARDMAEAYEEALKREAEED